MNHAAHTLRGEYFFQHKLPLFVNRNAESYDNPYHDHDFWELTYIAEGSGFHHIGNEVHPVHKGQMCFIPIGSAHVFRPLTKDRSRHSLIVYNCVFATQLLRKLIGYVEDFGFRQFLLLMEQGDIPFTICSDADDRLEGLFLEMHREYVQRAAGCEDVLQAQLLQLLAALYRSRQPARTDRHYGEEKSVQDVLRHIERYCNRELTLDSLSQLSGWSSRHLQRLFLRHTGHRFVHYLQLVRVRQARLLLRNTQMKIPVVAEMVGYRDIASFNAVFKRTTGMTPGHYRRHAAAGGSRAMLGNGEEPSDGQ